MLFQAAFLRVFAGLSTLSFTLSAARLFQSAAPSPMLVATVPETRSLENLAVRHNGQILVTSTQSSSLFLASPNKRGWASSIVIHQFANLTALLGIAELEEDVFYVTGAVSPTAANPYNEIWKVDVRPMRVTANGRVIEPAVVSHVVTVTSGALYNGMTRLASDDKRNILVADSISGTVTRVDVQTGNIAVVITDSRLGISNETNLAIGVNGIHTHGDRLFFTNLNQGIFGLVSISKATGEQTGSVEVLASELFVADDFVLSDDAKKAWVTMNGAYNLIEVDVATRTSRVFIDSTLLGAESSVAFAREECTNRTTMYITTSQPSGNTTIGGLVGLYMD